MKDFSIFDVVTGANAGFDLPLLTPHGKPSGVVLRVLGEDSDAYAEIETAQRAARIDRLRAAKGDMLSENEIKAELVDKLVAVTVGWTGPEGFAPYSPAAARELYSDRRYVTVNDQVIQAITDRRNFTAG